MAKKLSNKYKEVYEEKLVEIEKLKKKTKKALFMEIPEIAEWFNELTQPEIEILLVDACNMGLSDTFAEICQILYELEFI
jgi:hypothetical protein